MNTERAYYEIDEFWDPARTPSTDLERFRAIESHLPRDAVSLLDVGCGNGDLLHHLASLGTGQRLHGFDRSQSALRHVRTPKTQGDIDRLPFGNREFDCVIACEVIEHLPASIYPSALAEIARVARETVVITVPAAEELEAGHVACPHCRSRFNANYHFRRFTLATMRTLLSPHGFVTVTAAGLLEEAHYPGLATVMRWKKRLPPRRNPFNFAIPCPVCGASIPGAGVAPAIPSRRERWWEPVLRTAWPHVRRPRWLVGVYRRNDVGSTSQ